MSGVSSRRSGKTGRRRAARTGVPAQRLGVKDAIITQTGRRCHSHAGRGVIVTDRVGCHRQQNRMGVVVTDRAGALSLEWWGAIPKDTLCPSSQHETAHGRVSSPKTHCARRTNARPHAVGCYPKDTLCSSENESTNRRPVSHTGVKRPTQTGYSVPGITCVNRNRSRLPYVASVFTRTYGRTDTDQIFGVLYYTGRSETSHGRYTLRQVLRTGVEQRSRTRCPASDITHAHETTDTDRRPASGITQGDREPAADGARCSRFYAQACNTGHGNRHPRQVSHNPVKHPPRFTPPADGRRPPARAGSRRTPCR